MAESIKGLKPAEAKIDGTGLTIGIVHARWNDTVVGSLVAGAKKVIENSGASVKVVSVPGSYELLYGARVMQESKKVDALICTGCLIKGETMHFEYICEAVTQGIMKLNLEGDVPVIFGVLACMNEDQALARAGLDNASGKKHNHGPEWGQSALEMAILRRNTA